MKYFTKIPQNFTFAQCVPCEVNLDRMTLYEELVKHQNSGVDNNPLLTDL